MDKKFWQVVWWGKGGQYTITYKHTNTQITFSGEPGLDDDDDDSDDDNDDETLMVGETELDMGDIFFSGQVSEGRELDGEIYFSDSGSEWR